MGYPLLTRQGLGTFLLDPDGRNKIYSGMFSVIAPACFQYYTLTVQTAGPSEQFKGTDEFKATLCAAGNLTKDKYLDATFTALAQSLVGASTGPLGDFGTFSVGGIGVLSVPQVILSSVFGEDPSSAVVEDVAEHLGAGILTNYVGDYLADQTASLTIDKVKAALSAEGLVTGKASGTEVTQTWGPLNVNINYVYNPYSHFVFAFLSSDRAPDLVYVVSYQVGANGEKITGTVETYKAYSK
jgi:hypothetical protein